MMGTGLAERAHLNSIIFYADHDDSQYMVPEV